MKKIVLCEDIELERQILKDMLMLHFEEIGEEVSIIEYESGEALIADVEEGYLVADLLFLDIHMKEMNGMEVARRLRQMQRKGPIVFLTSSPDYAVESYEVEASGYLLKPYDTRKINELADRLLKNDGKKRVAVKSRRQKRYPYVDDIMYMDSDRHAVTLHMKDGTEIVTLEKLGDLEERIRERKFLRCHQSFLVNMDYIRDVEENFVLADDTRIPIRVRGRKDILKVYDDYFNRQK